MTLTDRLRAAIGPRPDPSELTKADLDDAIDSIARRRLTDAVRQIDVAIAGIRADGLLRRGDTSPAAARDRAVDLLLEVRNTLNAVSPS